MKDLVGSRHQSLSLHTINFVNSLTGMLIPTPFAHCNRPIFSVLANSDEESSSADSSDEEEQLVAEPQSTVVEKGSTAPVDG